MEEGKREERRRMGRRKGEGSIGQRQGRRNMSEEGWRKVGKMRRV